MASIIESIINGLAWLWSLISLVFGTIATFIRIFIDVIFNQLIFGLAGRILLGSLLLIGLGFAITEIHDEVFEQFDEFFCEVVDLRRIFAELSSLLAQTIEVFICFYNLISHWTSSLVVVFFEITLECGDKAYLTVLQAASLIILRSTEAGLTLLQNPFNNSFPFFSPQGDEAQLIPFMEPDQKDVWHAYVDFVNETRTVFGCLCEDSFLNDVYNFLADRATSPYIGCAIDQAINALISFYQELVNLLITLAQLEPDLPDLHPPLTKLCQAFICVGDYLDEWLFELLDLFLPGGGLDLNIGCAAARIACVITETVAFLWDIVAGGLSGNILDVLAEFNTDPIGLRLYELADCVEEVFTLIDQCLGEFLGNLVRLLPTLLELLTGLVRGEGFQVEKFIDAFLELLGNQRFDLIGAVHLGVADPSPNCPPNCDHANGGRPYAQTGLTCILAKTLGDSDCAQGFADLTNSVAQVFLIPVFVVDEIFVTDFSVLDFSGNPLDGDNRDAFNDLVLDISCVVTDRLLLVLDYLGHFVACIPGLEGLGDALVSLAEALDAVIDDIKSLLLLLVETIAQGVIWVFSLFGTDPFGNGSEGELITFFELFFDFFIEIFDLILEIVKGLVDFVLFPWFPALFDQGTLLSDNPGAARFTLCFEEFTDCICGITKNIADELCLPLGIGCLSDLWPDCDDFEPGRKRQFFDQNITMYDANGKIVYDGTVYEYWAEQFGDSYCGDVFKRWQYGPDEDTSVGESDGMEMINCISAMRTSAKVSHNLTDVPADFFVNPSKINETSRHVARGLGVVASTEAINLLTYYSEPAAVLGRPEGNPTYLLLNETLKALGINDTVAYNTVTGIRDALAATGAGVFHSINGSSIKKDTLSGQTWALMSNTGSLLNRGISVTVMVMQEMRANRVLERSKAGISSSTEAVYATMVENRKRSLAQDVEPDKVRFEKAERFSKRSVEYAAGTQEVLDSYQRNRFPFRVTKRSMQQYRMRRFARALWEYAFHLTGSETISPQYNARAEAIIEDHIPYSCTSLYVGCPYDFGVDNVTADGVLEAPPCEANELYANFRVCNDLFDLDEHAVVTNCVENFQAVAFYDSLAECEDINDNPVDPLFELRVAFNTTKCMLTDEAGWLCINGLDCTACPVDQVIPGFQCRYLDEVVHRLEYLTRRCIDKFGLGPPLPTIPTNVTEWFFDWVELRNRTLQLSPNCGNGELNNGTYCIRNPTTRREVCFDGEACDPPDWDVLSGDRIPAPGEQVCGPACQIVECGNGIIEGSEECDDGNNNNGDGCDAFCRREECGNGRLEEGGICRGPASSGFEGTNCDLDAFPIWQSWRDTVDANPAQHFCGTCVQDNVTDPLNGEPCYFFAALAAPVFNIRPVGCRCVQEGFCAPADENSPAFGQTCEGGYDHQGRTISQDASFVNTCSEGACQTPLAAQECGDPNLNCGQDSRLQCLVREQCDDGNTLSNDGCDSNCQIEKCPQIIYLDSFLNEVGPDDTVDQTDPAMDNRFCGEEGREGLRLQGKLPETCFSLPPADGNGTFSPTSITSVELNCKAGEPIVWIYNNPICDGNDRPFERKILANCSINDPMHIGQDPICTEALFNAEAGSCTLAVQTGLDFTCTNDCTVCGDGIVGNGEACDDGTIFPTENEEENNCIACRVACDCLPDPRVPCSGLCVGGNLNLQTCDPRAEEEQCDGFPCVGFECCGDGLEVGEELCDRYEGPGKPIVPYDPADPDGSRCLFCRDSIDYERFVFDRNTPVCECQEDKPCEGVCFDWTTGIAPVIRAERDVGTGLAVFADTVIPCDMRLEPFACPSENLACMPFACCGDGGIQSQIPGNNLQNFISGTFLETVDALVKECTTLLLTFDIDDVRCDAQGNSKCEPGESPACNDPVSCNYNRNDGFMKGDSEIFTVTTGLRRGRRDQCSCQPDKPCVGVCYNEWGQQVFTPEGDEIFCDRTGASRATKAALLNSTQGDSDCVAANITNGVCGAVACCGDANFQIPYEVTEAVTLLPCEPGPGSGLPALECDAVDTCNYEARWYFIDTCECQPGKPCLGRCSYYGEATDLFCDAADPSKSPWCNTSEAGYACHARGCCDDARLQAAHGADFGGDSFVPQLEEINPLENCDNQLCGPDTNYLNDCGLGENLYGQLVKVYTECECSSNTSFACVGYCVDEDDGEGTNTPTVCDPAVRFDNANCNSKELCLAQQCCGDGIVQWEEECDSGGVLEDSITFRLWNETDQGGTETLFVNADPTACVLLPDNQSSVIVNCSGSAAIAKYFLYYFNNSNCSGDPALTEDAPLLNLINFPNGSVSAASCTFGCPVDCLFNTNRRRSIPSGVIPDMPVYDSFWGAWSQQPSGYRKLGRRDATVIDYDHPSQHYVRLSNDVENSPITDFFIDLLDAILEGLGFSSTGDLTEMLVNFFTSTDIDIRLPPEERGLVWYIVFPFLCRSPDNTSCEGGIGVWDALLIVLPIFVLALLVIQLAIGDLGSIFIYIFGLLFLSVYLGVAFFYSFPGCALTGLPRLPECLGYEAADIFLANNGSCYEYWPDGLVLDPVDLSCPEDCERTLVDCKAIGFRDGFDTLFYALGRYFPGLLDVLNGNTGISTPDPSAASNFFFELLLWLLRLLTDIAVFIFQSLWSLLTSNEFFQEKIERFDYGLDPVPLVDAFCFKVTILNGAQVVFILLFGGLLLFSLISAAFLTGDRLWIFVARGTTFIGGLEEDDGADSYYY